jgi:AcrR family transcriptional regulator
MNMGSPLGGSMTRDLRDHLITTAARLIGQPGGAGIGVREIAREAQVADGVLYNYFADKEDLLANALLVHVAAVMSGLPGMPEPGTGTVAENLASFIETGLEWLGRVAPAFAGMISQPGVLSRFRAMVGGDAAFGAPADDGQAGEADQADEASPAGGEGGQEPGEPRGQGLPALLTGYLRAEQRLGRIGAGADIDAAVVLIVGAIHGQVLPRVLLGSPAEPAAVPPGLALRLAHTMLGGIGPGSGD